MLGSWSAPLERIFWLYFSTWGKRKCLEIFKKKIKQALEYGRRKWPTIIVAVTSSCVFSWFLNKLSLHSQKDVPEQGHDTDKGSDVRPVGVASPAGGTVLTWKDVFAGVLTQQWAVVLPVVEVEFCGLHRWLGACTLTLGVPQSSSVVLEPWVMKCHFAACKQGCSCKRGCVTVKDC